MQCGSSNAEKAIQLLVRQSSGSQLRSTTFTNDSRAEDAVNLLKWDSRKTMGIVFHEYPPKGSTLICEETPHPKVARLRSKYMGSSLFCQERGISSILYVQTSPRGAMHIKPCRAEYTFLSHVYPGASSVLFTRNMLDAFQSEITRWCFAFFVCYPNAVNIRVSELSRRFTALSAFTDEERNFVLEGAVNERSMGLLGLFEGYIVLRTRNRVNVEASLFLSEGVGVHHSLPMERFLANCWICCKKPLTTLIDAIRLIRDRLSNGYQVVSPAIIRSVLIVVSLLRFVITRNKGANSFEFFLSNLYLLSTDPLTYKIIECNNYEECLNLDEGTWISNSLEEHYYYAGESKHQGDYSLDVYSLFSQSPDGDPITASDLPCIKIEKQTNKSEVSHQDPNGAELFFDNSKKLLFLSSLDFDSFPRLLDNGNSHLRLTLHRTKEKPGEAEALEAVRAAARKRRRIAED